MEPPITKQHSQVTLVECPRDAMQGWLHFIPTQQKIEYLNALLQVGFDTLDFGSFVSPKAIPQMADTKQVISKLSIGDGKTKLLAIVANLRGAEEAVIYEQIQYIGFPFSISPTFQLRNTHSSMEESVKTVEAIQELCIRYNRILVLYLSMGFGNPYGDPYNEDILLHWAEEMAGKGIRIISLADTVGIATPEQVSTAVSSLISAYPDITIGVHLHSNPENWKAKAEAAWVAGCSRFDGALKGIGGCPMAQDSLVGNMNSEWMIPYFEEKGLLTGIDKNALLKSRTIADQLFK